MKNTWEVVRKWPALDPQREDPLFCGLSEAEAKRRARLLDETRLSPWEEHVARQEDG